MSLPPIRQQPGAGLPFIEQVLSRYVIFPLFCAQTSWESAVELFDKEGERILKCLNGLSEEQLKRRILIPHIRGLEDSSRDWSILMTLRHVIVVTNSMKRIMEGLALQNVANLPDVRIEDVKPDDGDYTKDQVLKAYELLLEGYSKVMKEPMIFRPSPYKHPHPWFGYLNNHQWLCLSAIHHQVHRKQIEQIKAKLKR